MKGEEFFDYFSDYWAHKKGYDYGLITLEHGYNIFERNITV
jgi:hypothetical protein